MKRTVPEPGTYCRVLTRSDRAAHLPLRFSGYDCSVVAVPAIVGGKEQPTLFFPNGKENAADRALKQSGWFDVTEAYAHEHGHSVEGRIAIKAREETAALEAALGELDWNALRRYASDRGVDATGGRPELTARILNWSADRAAAA